MPSPAARIVVPARRALALVCTWLAASAVATVPAVAAAQQAEVAAAAPADGAPATIARFNATLLDIMRRSDELGYQGRYDTVAPVLRETFDVAFMAAKTIGSTWRKLDGPQRKRWVEAFEGYTVSNFADRFDGFSGETLEIVGEKPASHETLVVLTRLTRPGEDDVELNYRMREASGGWRVVDIYADGTVSEIALRRSEYAAVLKQGGIEKLIASVNAKTAERAAGD